MGDLYLLGGDSGYADMAETFVDACGGANARIALLLQGGTLKSRTYLPQYRDPILRCGASEVIPVMREVDGNLDIGNAVAILGAVTGVIIGGGHTPTYLSLYGTGPLGESLRNLSHGTTPIAGQSAGALIMPEVCAIPPEDTGADQVTIDVGLGLIENMVVGVHFTERDAQPHVLAAMAKTRTSRGLGIDEGACAIVRANQVRATVGTGVYEIEMQNFDKPDHTLRKLA